MRTTLTLDPDVARMVQDEAHRRRQSFKRVVNDALRRGLSARAAPRRRPYRVKPHSARLAAGLDAGRLNALVDTLEDEARIPRLAARGRR